MIAALFVETNGCYFGLDSVDPWDINRDARLYNGPYPVIAHPPCERWGTYARGGPNPRARKREIGDDGGCFRSALDSIRRFGGVIEHPRGSHAWSRFGINPPRRGNGWTSTGTPREFTTSVYQGSYGHLAPKETWLVVSGVELAKLPYLNWAKPDVESGRMDLGPRSKLHADILRCLRIPREKRLSVHDRIATPIGFRDLLISIAGNCSK